MKELLTKSEKKEIEQILQKAVEQELRDIMNLDNVEKLMTKIFQELREGTTKKIIEGKDPKIIKCIDCGKKMKIKEKAERKIKGLVEYKIIRRNFYCKNCNKYIKPLDEIIDCDGRFSLEVKEGMLLLGQRIPFEEASYFLNKLMHVEVSHESIRELVEDTGERMFKDEKKRIESIIDKEGFISNFEQTDKIKTKPGVAYLQMDGSMVQTREEGWKEVRNGLLFFESNRVETDKNHKKIIEKKYFSVFNNDSNSLNQFKCRTTQIAYDYGFQNSKIQVILGDGAPWIWEYASTYQPEAIQILDYYHACEYLGCALKALHLNTKEDQDQKTLHEDLFSLLREGEIEELILFLRRQQQVEDVKKCVRYFNNNINRMDYGTYRKMELDIGSGAIESAHRIIVQTRMKQSGMHWGKKNVQSILSLRAAYLSGEWNSIVKNYLKSAA